MFRGSVVLASLVTLAFAACGKVETAQPDAPVTPTATVIVTLAGGGGGTVSSSPGGISCGSDCSEDFDVGTTVTLTAAADGTSTFTGWSGGGCTGTGPCTITVTADAAVTATFAENNSLNVTTDGTGDGTVTSSPGGINCGSDCTETYPSGTVVTLTAAADASSSFTGWSGAGCTGTGTCVVTVDQARAVNATFTLNRYALSVTRSGSGSGTVTSDVAGISCGADCTEEYDHGTVVVLTAAASVGSTFVGWSGASCTGTGTCTVTVTAITAVTANFSINQDSLTVMRAGNGTGTVTSSPAGINCGADCDEIYNFGQIVTLTATPASGSTFTGWSGGGCSGTGTCMTTINGPTAVTATFTLQQFTLTVTRAGTGTGTVTSSPAGINCGTDCTETYNFGQMVTLTAAAASGSTFTGWSGACSGTGACTVSMTAARAVTATFAVNQFTLSVTRAGTGSGTVTSSPAGISCGADCSEVYNQGTVVTLTATAAVGSAFAGWSGGGCSGLGNCTVTINAATSVTATFNSTACTGSQTFNHTGAMQTFTVPACATTITVDAFGAQGGHSTGENGMQNFTGGLGARARGTFTVVGGQQINVMVGGRGAANIPPSICGAGGGGGSFVVRGTPTAANIMVIAGGGGGGFHCNAIGGANGVGGQTGPDGTGGVPGPMLMRPIAPGGTGGNGATMNGFGGGGGGYFTNGSAQFSGSMGGTAYANGGAGGVTGGGFGGGGSYHNTCCGGAGGGGGYSGGGGGTSDGCSGGGAGSFNNGTAQIMTAATRAGDGVVTISW